MAELRRDLGAGDGAALERFWQEVADRGTPLVEPAEDDPHHRLVTFLWQTPGGWQRVVRTVGIASALSRGGLIAISEAEPLACMEGTDVWHRTYLARSDLRTLYTIAVNGAPPEFREADPLNRSPWSFAGLAGDAAPAEGAERPFTRTMTVSTVTLPDAPPQPWCDRDPGVASGRVECHRLPSAALGGEVRRVWVYTSPGAEAGNEDARLLLFFDGWFYAYPCALPTTLDNLCGSGRIAPVVAVLVDNPIDLRNRDLGRSPSVFQRFIVDELLPWVCERYRVRVGPGRTLVGGFSTGGRAAASMALDHPELFGNVLSQSGLFHYTSGPDGEGEPLARRVAAEAPVGVRFALDVGLLETGSPPEAEWPSLLVANRHLRTVLQAKGYRVHYREYVGGHDCLCWRGTLAEGLLALLGDGGP